MEVSWIFEWIIFCAISIIWILQFMGNYFSAFTTGLLEFSASFSSLPELFDPVGSFGIKYFANFFRCSSLSSWFSISCKSKIVSLLSWIWSSLNGDVKFSYFCSSSWLRIVILSALILSLISVPIFLVLKSLTELIISRIIKWFIIQMKENLNKLNIKLAI